MFYLIMFENQEKKLTTIKIFHVQFLKKSYSNLELFSSISKIFFARLAEEIKEL